MMEQSRKATEAKKIALQQAREAMADKDAAVSEAKKATSRENSMLELMNEAAADISGIFSLNQNSFSLYVVSLLFFEICY
jgi:hypothetical protein